MAARVPLTHVVLRSVLGWGYEVYRRTECVERNAGDGWDKGTAERVARVRVQELAGGKPRAARPDSVRAAKVSDGERVVLRCLEARYPQPMTAWEIAQDIGAGTKPAGVLLMMQGMARRRLVSQSTASWSADGIGWAMTARGRASMGAAQ